MSSQATYSLEMAESAINSVCAADITELRNFRAPPMQAILICDALLVLLGVK